VTVMLVTVNMSVTVALVTVKSVADQLIKRIPTGPGFEPPAKLRFQLA